jgi:hypothetical protein
MKDVKLSNIVTALIIGVSIVIAASIIGNAIDQAGLNISNRLMEIAVQLRP